MNLPNQQTDYVLSLKYKGIEVSVPISPMEYDSLSNGDRISLLKKLEQLYLLRSITQNTEVSTDF